jgi:Amt family ammonium transporter
LAVFYSKGIGMAIDSWLPTLLGYLIPIGLFLLAWGGMRPDRARRAATLGALALGLASLGYFSVGFAFHLGGAAVLAPDAAGLRGLDRLWGPSADWGLVGLEGFFLANEADTPEALALFVTYLPMAAAAALLPVLSASERGRGWQVTVGGVLMAAVLFPLAACWAWGRGWLAQLGISMNFGHGYVDHAGSGVVLFLGGMAALGALVGLGERLPRGEPGEPEDMPPAHFPLLANLGALLFGLGYLGWSLAVPFHATGAQLNVPRIAANMLLAGGGAVLTSQFYCWLTVGHADPLMAARGTAAGFVVVAAGAPFIPAWAAFLSGLLAGAVLPLAVYLIDRVARLPDESGAVSLGAIVGLLGLLVVPLLADGRWGQGWNGVGVNEYRTVIGQGVTGALPAEPFVGDGQGQLLAQLVGIGALGTAGFVFSWLMFLVMSLPYRRRATRPARTLVRTEVIAQAPEPKAEAVAAGDSDATPGERRGPLRIFDLVRPHPDDDLQATEVPSGMPESSAHEDAEETAQTGDSSAPEDGAGQLAQLWDE